LDVTKSQFPTKTCHNSKRKGNIQREHKLLQKHTECKKSTKKGRDAKHTSKYILLSRLHKKVHLPKGLLGTP